MDIEHRAMKYKTKYNRLKNDYSNHMESHHSRSKKSKGRALTKNKIEKFQNADYVENVSEPWYSFISMGLKVVEGRKDKGKFHNMKVGELIEWQNYDFAPRHVLTRIVYKKRYTTFKDYLELEGMDRCLPGMTTLNHGLSVYYKYYTPEDEATYGVMAITLELIT